MSLRIHRLAALLSCGIGAVIPATGHAEPEVEIDTIYYDVEGRTADEVRRDMDWESPFREAGRNFVAATKWHVNWRYRSWETRNSCTLTRVDTRVRISVTLPRLLRPELLDPALQSRWQQYVEALQRHEQGHVDLALQAARDVEERIAAIPPQASCAALRDAVDRIGDEVIAQYHARERAYDRETDHGMNTGAVFP